MDHDLAPAGLTARKIQTVYFAYGSNLHLKQMATRCPESRYIGRRVLRDFKWQINRRGYANVFLSPGDSVEGLCYLLSQEDEKGLDRNEGVPTDYEKTYVTIHVFSANAAIIGRRVRELDEYIYNQKGHDPDLSRRNHSCWYRSEDGQTLPSIMPKPHSTESDTVEGVLVYINWTEVLDGAPKIEYIARIKSGVGDGVALGIPEAYFEQYVQKPMDARASES